MERTDGYLDAMLRHLGAAYYESLHGRATRTGVARALDIVEEHLNEHSPHTGPARTPPARTRSRTTASRGTDGGPAGSAT